MNPIVSAAPLWRTYHRWCPGRAGSRCLSPAASADGPSVSRCPAATAGPDLAGDCGTSPPTTAHAWTGSDKSETASTTKKQWWTARLIFIFIRSNQRNHRKNTALTFLAVFCKQLCDFTGRICRFFFFGSSYILFPSISQWIFLIMLGHCVWCSTRLCTRSKMSYYLHKLYLQGLWYKISIICRRHKYFLFWGNLKELLDTTGTNYH